MDKRILFVGGSFDDNGGRPSSLAEKVNTFIVKEGYTTEFYNGGNYNELTEIIQHAKDADITIWWANVPNTYAKIRDVKEVNYKTITVLSKRDDDNTYSYQDILSRMFVQKMNLCVVFKKEADGKFSFYVTDPLGNIFYSGNDIEMLAKTIVKRASFVSNITRHSTLNAEESRDALNWYFNMFKEEMLTDTSKDVKDVLAEYDVYNKKHFLQVVKDYAPILAGVIFRTEDPVKITRFLGNASFRCPKGFPSFREGEYIFVSKRNVDKSHITIDEFIPTYLKDNKVYYLGENKPSVDSPVQLQLYDKLPNIKYMLHTHTYIKGAPFTNEILPCGALEEVAEIMNALEKNYEGKDTKFAVINLLGHGCLIMSDDVDKIEATKDKIIARPKPEYFWGAAEHPISAEIYSEEE